MGVAGVAVVVRLLRFRPSAGRLRTSSDNLLLAWDTRPGGRFRLSFPCSPAGAPVTRAHLGITPSLAIASRNAAGDIYLVKMSPLCVLVSACSSVTEPQLSSATPCSSKASWSSPSEIRWVRFK